MESPVCHFSSDSSGHRGGMSFAEFCVFLNFAEFRYCDSPVGYAVTAVLLENLWEMHVLKKSHVEKIPLVFL